MEAKYSKQEILTLYKLYNNSEKDLEYEYGIKISSGGWVDEFGGILFIAEERYISQPRYSIMRLGSYGKIGRISNCGQFGNIEMAEKALFELLQ
jgi:hypothetical protein